MPYFQPISVAFVDDHPAILAGMSSIFSGEEEFTVLGVGSSADDAKALVAEHRPDIIFIDLSMPGDVVGAIREITTKMPPTKVIVLTAFSNVQSAMRVLEAGAMGFVLKGSSFDDLFDAVEAVRRGELYVTRKYMSEVMTLLRDQEQQRHLSRPVKLSTRERQIVRHLLEARTNREIATSLSISEQTVKNYMSGLMNKLNARNRVEVAVAAQKNADLD